MQQPINILMMYIHRYEVITGQVEGLGHRYAHLIFSHLLLRREVEDPSDGRVLQQRQTDGERGWGEERPVSLSDTPQPTCLALSHSFLQTAATSRVSVGNLCWQWSKVQLSVVSWTRSHRQVTALSSTDSTSPNRIGTRRISAATTQASGRQTSEAQIGGRETDR